MNDAGKQDAHLDPDIVVPVKFTLLKTGVGVKVEHDPHLPSLLKGEFLSDCPMKARVFNTGVMRECLLDLVDNRPTHHVLQLHLNINVI